MKLLLIDDLFSFLSNVRYYAGQAVRLIAYDKVKTPWKHPFTCLLLTGAFALDASAKHRMHDF
jgi:hypothetical protein